MSSEHLVHLTDDNFQDEIIKSPVPALVDFWAEWCMPCKMIAPTIEELAGEYAGRAKIAKMDIDAHRKVATQLRISAIPTLMLFKDGQVVNKFVGLQQKADLKNALDKLLAE